MAQIREELILYDKFTNTFTQYIRLGEQAARVTNQATETTRTFTQAQQQATRTTSSLTGQVKSLVSAYLGFQTVKGLFNLSDSIAATTARLERMNDGLQTTSELNQMIYDSAMRSRGAYTETAAFVAKLGTLAGDAFSSSAEIVAFAEQINKQMALSGTTTQEAQAAMLQLTQGLSSGVLRGEELNSVLEQTPMIAQTIADYMGVTTGEMRELASEGAVTAEVVKNAMFAAAEETNAAFAQMPMTWGQVWTQMQNIAIKALDPVLDGVNWLANHVDDALSWVEEHADGVAAVLAGLGAIALVAGAQMVGSALMSAAAWAAANWPILLVGASVAALIYMALKAGATFEEVGGVIGGVFGSVYAFAMNNCIVPLQRGFAAIANFIGNVFNDPVAAIKVLFYDMVLSVLEHVGNLARGIESLLNKIPGVEVNLTSGIDRITNSVQTARQNAINAGNYTEYVKAWDYVDYANAWNQGAEIGSRVGNAIENFSLSDAISGFTSSAYDGVAGTLDSIAGDVGSIKKSVNMSDEDIKSLVDIAERRYVNNVNLLTQAPVINVQGQNTGDSAADRKALGDAIRDILIEQASAGTVRSTARAYSG